MLFAELIWPGVLLPALVAAVLSGTVLLLPWRLPSRTASAIGVSMGYFIAHGAISGVPRMPPVESTEWLAWLVLVGGALALLTARRRSWLPALATSAVAGAGLWFTVRPLAEYAWSTGQTIWWLAALVAMGAVFFLADVGGPRRATEMGAAELDTAEMGAPEIDAAALGAARGGRDPGVLLVASSVAAIALGLSASARLAQLCGALVAALAAATLVARVADSTRRSRPEPTQSGAMSPGASRSAVPPEVGSLLSSFVPAGLAYLLLLVNGTFYAELDRWGALALWAAPTAGALLHRRARTLRRPWHRLGPLLATLAIASVALILAVAQNLEQAPGPYGY